MKLGKLSRVDLREYWKHEVLEVTRWLSEPENIELLSDEVGIGIEVTQTEASVGRFNVDILAEEENTGRMEERPERAAADRRPRGMALERPVWTRRV